MPKVLLVDDSLSVRKVMERGLASRAVEVISAASGAEAVDRIEREQPDVVVCDVFLPDKDGYQICEFVRNHPRLGTTPVLLMSGIVNGSVLERAAQVRSNEVMLKPFPVEALARKIDGLLGPRATPAAAGAPALPELPRPVSLSAPAAAPVPAASVAPVPAPAPPRTEPTAPATDARRARLNQLLEIPGLKYALLVDARGVVLGAAGQVALEAPAAGALAVLLAGAERVGRGMGHGAMDGLIIECGAGAVLLHRAGPGVTLIVSVADVAALGRARYHIRKALPDLGRAR